MALAIDNETDQVYQNLVDPLQVGDHGAFEAALRPDGDAPGAGEAGLLDDAHDVRDFPFQIEPGK